MGVVDNTAEVELVRYRPSFEAICSISNIPFSGTLEIQIRPRHKLIEFIDFDRRLNEAISEKPILLEDVARIAVDLVKEDLGGGIPVRVTVYAMTTAHAPAEARISSSWEE